MEDKEFPLDSFEAVSESADIIRKETQRFLESLSETQRWCDAQIQKYAGGRDREDGETSGSLGDFCGKKRSLSPACGGPGGKKSKVELALEKEKEGIIEENDQLKMHLSKARAEIKDLTLRLSKEMEVKIARDETSLENICVKNRPMNVAEEYQLFCSDVWLDAKSALDEYMDNPAVEDSAKESEEEMLTLLHDILMTAQHVLSTVHSEMIAQIRTPLEQVDHPMLFVDQKRKQVKPEPNPLTLRGSSFQQFDNAVGDILRTRADNVDAKQFKQLVYTKLSEKHRDVEEDIIEHVQEVDVYTEKACSLVWKMVLQRPKMTLDTPGLGEPWMGDSYQEVWWGSDDPEDPSSTVTCYVHPILYHGDKVMAKGKVVLKKVQSKAKEVEKVPEMKKGAARDVKVVRKEEVVKFRGARRGKAISTPRKLKK